MNILNLIDKKIRKESLEDKEIEFLINSFVKNEIKDYQMSAFCMAVVLNGMDTKEIAFFTKCMTNSGDTIDLSSIDRIKVDKHSTGGVGDKTTIVIAPIVASLGAAIAKMSGKGLGHTGGTLDKLQSIPGYEIELSEKDFIKQVKDINIAIIGQTNKIVPADKKLYALRDVTGTINSIALIASSIMSKKLATGADTILLDVKWGNGAFMKEKKDAQLLANTMINVGKELGKDVRALITDMNTPLGKAIGNKNEIIEAIETLKGNGPKDFKNLVYKISSIILVQSKITDSLEEANKLVEESITSGKALKTFKTWIKAQHGDIKLALSDSFWNPKYKLEIFAEKNGNMEIISAIDLGKIATELGAGRQFKDDIIDYDAGININKKTGDKVKKGDLLFTLFSSNEINKDFLEKIKKTFKLKNF